jgi:hypothetical protein
MNPWFNLCLALCVLGAPAVTTASPLFPLPAGPVLTLAGSSSPRTVQAAANNPAAPAASDLGSFWFGLGTVSAGYETGDFDNLSRQIETLEQDLRLENLSQEDAEQLRDRANAFLQQLGKNGYAKVFANAQPPLLPLGGSSAFLGGTVTFGAVGFTGARTALLDDPVKIVEQSTGNFRIDSDTAGHGKAAAGAIISLGYSSNLHRREDGLLSLGARLNYYTVELSQGVVALKDLDANGVAETQDALEQEFDRNRRRASAIGLDFGALWGTENFRAGATLRNLNEPAFDYAALGQNCAARAGTERLNCETAAAFIAASRIAALETYRMERHLQLESALYTADRTWSLATTWDANSLRDAAGDEYQWLSLSGAFSPRGSGWLIPGVRTGYRHNLAGTRLDLVSLGVSLFRLINLDVAASTQRVEDDGDKGPRSALASLSLELFF